MNSKNSKTSHPHRLFLNLSGKVTFKKKGQIFCSIKSQHIAKDKKVIQNNKFKISAIKYGKNTGNPSIKIYVKKK